MNLCLSCHGKRYSSDSRVIISASARGVIVVSSASAGSTLRVFSDHKGARITGFDTTLSGAFDPANCAAATWLACGADRRITVWKSDWTKDACDLVDWLTFPAPPFVANATAPAMPPTVS